MRRVDLLPEVAGEPGRSSIWGPEHRAVVGLTLAGFNRDEIADRMNVEAKFVTRTLSDPRAQVDSELTFGDTQLTIGQLIETHVYEAVETVVEVMRDGEKDEVRLRAAKTLMESAGYGPVKKTINLDLPVPADEGLLAVMRETLAEVASTRSGYQIRPKADDLEIVVVE